ncbi:MAG: quinone oxidoreductase [Vicinamibacteria bacterium]|jgi:NADPH2:quinone reductase|nr:quinone oxidoreductase [Vicinamibacteria bacterium]
MKAIRVHELGGPAVLHWEEAPDPVLMPDQALIHIDAVGLNYIDTYHRTGLYPPSALPFIPGVEAAGSVVARGEGVVAVKNGDRVAFAGPTGAYAEFVAVPADRLVILPHDVSARQAAGLMLQGMTAHYLTCSTYVLGPADTCLVHAAAGGVGQLICQLAKYAGARVIGTVGGEHKARIAKEAGAREVIDYTQQDFVAEVKRLTNGQGVQVVYDGVGRATFDGSLNCLAPRGMLILFGQASGPVPPFDAISLSSKGSLFLTRPNLSHYIARREELLVRANDVFNWTRNGALSVHIEREYPLKDAAEAHRALEARETTGKVVLIP